MKKKRMWALRMLEFSLLFLKSHQIHAACFRLKTVAMVRQNLSLHFSDVRNFAKNNNLWEICDFKYLSRAMPKFKSWKTKEWKKDSKGKWNNPILFLLQISNRSFSIKTSSISGKSLFSCGLIIEIINQLQIFRVEHDLVAMGWLDLFCLEWRKEKIKL